MNKEYANEIAALKKENAELETKVIAAREGRDAYKTCAQTLKQTVKNLTTELPYAMEEIDKLKKTNPVATHWLNAKNDEIATLKQTIQNLTTELAHSMEEINKLKAKCKIQSDLKLHYAQHADDRGGELHISRNEAHKLRLQNERLTAKLTRLEEQDE